MGVQTQSADPQEQEEAARRITEAFTGQLLLLINKRLGHGLRRRVDPEDVLQSVFKSFFHRDPSFANRNEMFAYLVKVAVNKAKNVVRYHGQEKRDVRKEQAAKEDSGGNFPGGGRKPSPDGLAGRPYLRRIDIRPDQVGSADSFFSNGALESMAYGAEPVTAAIVVDLFDRLRDYDEREGDRLRDIVSLRLEGYPPAEIAERLGISKRTVERKLETVAMLWDKSKTVRVVVNGGAGDPDGTTAIVLPGTTASRLLAGLYLRGYRLARVIQGEPGRFFDPGEELYGYVTDGETLLASLP